MSCSRYFLGALGVFALLVTTASAQIESIPGVNPKPWNQTSTWVGGVVPTVNDDVVITSGSYVSAGSGGTYLAATVTVAENGRLGVAGGTVFPVFVSGAKLLVDDLIVEDNAEFNYGVGSTFEFSGNLLSISALASVTELPNLNYSYSTFHFKNTFDGNVEIGNRHLSRVVIENGARVFANLGAHFDNFTFEGALGVTRDLEGLSGLVDFDPIPVSLNIVITPPAKPGSGKSTNTLFTVEHIAGNPAGVVNDAFDQGEHFVISSTATNFEVDLTLPHTLAASDSNAFVTLVEDTDLFDAARDSSTSTTVTRNGITSFSASGDTYAVTNGFVVPVELGEFLLQ